MVNRDQILNDPETATRYALSNLQSQMWTSFPAIVTSVDFSQMTLECVPAIKGVNFNEDGSINSYFVMPKLVDVPIVFPSAGGFSLTLPVKAGNEVLVSISNRCIDAWWQSGGIQQPIELRMHDLSDGFAIPGPKSLPNVIGDISATNAQLRTDDGTCYLEITPTGGINMTAPSGVTITGDLNVTGEIDATGDIDSGGNITAALDVIATTGAIGTVTLGHHRHANVVNGPNSTNAGQG